MLGGHLDDMEKDWIKLTVGIRYHATPIFCHKFNYFLPCSRDMVNILKSELMFIIISFCLQTYFSAWRKIKGTYTNCDVPWTGDAVLMAGEAREYIRCSISS